MDDNSALARVNSAETEYGYEQIPHLMDVH